MLLFDLKKRVNLYRRSFHWRQSGCIFIHVPKAAGTSINKALYGKTLGHYTADEIKRTFPVLYERAFTFSVVRNPWDRALSAYYFAKKGRTESMGVYKPEQYQIPEFETFELFVNEWLPKQDLLLADFIFKPQYHFLFDRSDELLVDYLGKVEDLESAIAQVSKKLGRDLRVGKDNSTRDVDAKGYRREFKTDQMIDTIYSIYKPDIDKFNYKF